MPIVSMVEGVHERPGHPLSEAVLRVLAYADVFCYPLTVAEIHKYLEVAATHAEVLQALTTDPWLQRRVAWNPPLIALTGREECFGRRQRRQQTNHDLWKHALRSGRTLAAVPFVRMVAVTGALAVDNTPDSSDDIDYLLVTTPSRLWLARFLVIILVRLLALQKVRICPNYLLTLDAIDQFDHSLFSAHELAQMVLLYGSDVYEMLLQANSWARDILPNAFSLDGHDRVQRLPVWLCWPKQAVETLLAGKLGDTLEQYECGKKIRQLSHRAKDAQAQEARFSARYCKGHMSDHGIRIAQAYAERIEYAKKIISDEKVS